MVLALRRVPDWCRAERLCLLAILLMGSARAVSGQVQYVTPDEKNKRIEELSALAEAHPVNTPLGSGDLIHIDVFDVPELSRDARIDDTGDIGFPLIRGQIHAAGLTPLQLSSELEKLLVENGLVSHPNVSVFVKEQTSQPVSVVGAVQHPVIYQVVRPTTLLEVLTAAGGVSDLAGDTVMITRPVLSSTKTDAGSSPSDTGLEDQKITIRLRDLLESGDSVYNVPVYGGDTVTVPPAGIVYVLGFGVAQPGGYVLQGHGAQITALKALAIAHGATNFAKLDDSVIMRTNSATGQRDSIPVHLKQIQSNKAPDVPLQTTDILYIPDSRTKKALAKGAETALQVGTAIAIYQAY
jgi:polysaccharide biosynthesis/export protein